MGNDGYTSADPLTAFPRPPFPAQQQAPPGSTHARDGVPDHECDTSTLDLIMRSNVVSLFWLTKAAMPHLQPGSAIITASSIQAFQPSPRLIEYATPKAAIANVTRGAARQLAERRIAVNGAAPGPFWTPVQPATADPEHLVNVSGETVVVNGGEPGR